MYKKFIISFVIIALIVGCFIAVWANKKEPTQEEKLKLKLNEEIEYLSSSIISIANNLNNIKIEDYKVTEKGNEKANNENSNNSKQEENKSSGEKSEGKSSNESSKNESSSQKQSSSSNSSQEETEMNYETVQNKIDTENINWDEIEKEIEQLYGVWSEVLIDLHQTNNNIVEFGKTIDETTKYIESKDKVNSLKMVAKLYNYLPMFMNDYKAQSKKIAYINTKSKIINAYSNIEEENWDEIKKQTSEAINEFNSILNDVQNNKNQYNVNKTYVLLNEFQNSIDTNDKKILYIKYKNLIQEMEEIKI